MSLLADLSDAYALANGQDPATPAPVRYTTLADRYAAGGGTLFGGSGRKQQLDLTTSESTLFSVLELISSTVGATKWYGQRKVKNPRDGVEPPRVGPDQNLAVKLWGRPNRFMRGRFVRTMLTWHYKAVGEAWAVMDYLVPGMPRAWWPVRPDRMWPVPDPDDYLVGYIYVGPDGTKVPLELDEVMRMMQPHPLDTHRGLGAVQTLGTTLGISLSSAEWIAKFFQNDASPGGIIEIPEGLGEGDYQRLRKRWNEQHRGVSKAHRIAILEYGKFVPRQFHMRDMQFTEVRELGRDTVLEAFRVHKHKMGISDTVNLANAFAADTTYARDTMVPVLEAWEELANDEFTPQFGAPGQSVELCYENPVPEDKEEERTDRQARIRDARELMDMGVPAPEAWDFVRMPNLTVVPPAPEDSPGEKEGADTPDDAPAPADDPMLGPNIVSKIYLATKGQAFLEPEESRQIAADAGLPITPGDWQDDDPAPAPIPPGGVGVQDPVPEPEDPVVEGDQAVTALAHRGTLHPSGGAWQDAGGDPDVPADRDPGLDKAGNGGRVDLPQRTESAAVTVDLQLDRSRSPAGEVDLSPMGDDWQEALDRLLALWPGILDDQYSELARQVRTAIDAGDLPMLLQLSAPDAGAAEALAAAMVAAAGTGAAAIAREAEDQGVSVTRHTPSEGELTAQAGVVTGLMRAQLAISAGVEAMRVQDTGVSGAEVAALVREHLDALTDAQPALYLGGALTAAQHQGRMATLEQAPTARYYASEVLDANTCGPCRRVDGKQYETLDDTREDYPGAAYRECEGRQRCRGTIVAVWTVGGDENDGEG